MPLQDLELTRAHEQICRAEFAILDAIKLRRDDPENRDALSNQLGSIGEATRHLRTALDLLKTEQDAIAKKLQTGHHATR